MSGHNTQLRSILSFGFLMIFATAAAFFVVDKGMQAIQEIDFLNNGPFAKRRIVLVEALGSDSATTSADVTGVNTLGWKTYRNKKYGFEVMYPPRWNLEAISSYDAAGKVVATQSEFLFTDLTLHRIIITPFGDLVADNSSNVSETKRVNFTGIIGRWRKFTDFGGAYEIAVDQFHIASYPRFSILLIPINARSNIDPEKSHEFEQILSTFKFVK